MNNEKIVRCKCCGNKILKKNDLIVTNKVFSVGAYHNNCYCKEMIEKPIIVKGKFIINSVYFNINAILAMIIGLIWLIVVKEFRYCSAIFFIIPLMKAYSWVNYEKKI